MGELRGISGKEAIRRFTKIGYLIVRQKGSHVRLHHPTRRPLTIPMHKELQTGLLRQLIQDTGIDVETFRNLK
jgi:predicted RNA binding protein YcfA (HicA-like mRNA interferase family)